MARLIIAAAVALAFFGGPGLSARQPASSSDETARINAWFEKKYEEQLAFSPIQQTFLGRKSAAIDDMSIAAQDKQLAWQRASVAEMKQAFDYAKLTPEAQTSYNLWIYQLQQAEAFLPFRSNAYVFDQMSAIHAFFPQLLMAFHRVDDTADLEAYVARIRESGRALRQLIEISKRNVVAGMRPPRFSFDFVIDESTKIVTGAPFDKSGADSAVWADVKAKVAELQKKGTLNEAKAERAPRRRARGAGRTVPRAYQDLIAWQKEDCRNAPEKTSGVGALPNGAAYYRERLANQTTTDLSADEIHRIGLDEVARLRGEMEAIAQGGRVSRATCGPSSPSFATRKTTAASTTPTLTKAAPRTSRMRRRPSTGSRRSCRSTSACCPRPTSSSSESSRSANSRAPRSTTSRARRTAHGPGVYYAHLADMKAMPKARARGHRLSRGYAGPSHADRDRAGADEPSRPSGARPIFTRLRRKAGALYAEWLAREMPGTYQDPYSRFGRLGSEMWRAIRLVRRYRAAREGLDRGTGRAVLPRQLGDDRAAGPLRGAALHGHARPGHQLQDRDAEDPGAAPEGRSRAR